MPRVICLLLLMLLIVGLCGCPITTDAGDPNTADMSPGGGSGGGGGDGTGGADGGDPNGIVGPPVPDDGEPNTPADVATNDLRVTVSFFETLEPATGALVTVRTSGFLSTVVCSETTGFSGQVTCVGLPVGLYQVTATVTDSFGFPTTGSGQVLVLDTALAASANITIGP